MKNPETSIIIPVYNAENSIKKICSSIFRQNYSDYELLLINDGSTDNTARIIEALAKKPFVTAINKPNGGPSSARNTGLKKSRGTYVVFFDADDNIPTNCLENLVGCIKSTKSDLVTAGWRIDLNKRGKVIENYKTIIPKERIVTDDLITHTVRSIGDNGEIYNLWNKIFRSDIIKNNSITFDEDLRFGEDLLFIFEYIKKCSKIGYLPKVTYYYTAESSSSVFRSSALSVKYRKHNSEALELFARESKNPDIKSYTAWVQSRWFLSFSLQVQKSNLEKKQKLEKLSKYPLGNVTGMQKLSTIGFRKYFIHKLIYLFRDKPTLMLFFATFINIVKKVIVSLKSLL